MPCDLRVRFLRFLGYKIGKKAIIKPFSILLAKEIEIRDHAKVDNFAIIAGLGRLFMDHYSAISRFTYISGKHNLVVGPKSLVGSRSIVSTSGGDVVFGNYSVLAPRSTIHTHGTFLPVTLGYGSKNKGVTIGDYVWIMQSTSIGPGVNIDSNSIILPGSSIVKNIPKNIVVFDSPVDRKQFPINFFKKELSDIELRKMVVEMTTAYLDSLKNKGRIQGFSLENDLFIITMKRRKKIFIFLDRSPQNETSFPIEGSAICIFGVNLGLQKISASPYFTVDFKAITTNSVPPPKEFGNFHVFMAFEYGMRFSDVLYEGI